MKILLTGVTGTLGSRVCELLTDHEVIGISRDEQKLRVFPKFEHVRLKLCDIRDKAYLSTIVSQVDMIIHCAALKCVDTLEAEPFEAIKTNLLGTQNLCELQEHRKLTMASTDKAVYPINTYGMTKALAEKLVLSNPINVVCRYGNVIGSRGSIIPIFIDKIKRGQPIELTDIDMTRFWINIDQAAKFVVGCSMNMGGLRIPYIRSYKVIDLVILLMELLDKRVDIQVVGKRAGEKIHECLINELEGKPLYSNECLFNKTQMKSLLEPLINGSY